MRNMWNRSRTGRGWFAAGLALVVAAPASAGTVYRWRTDDGTLAYTNIEKQIPERYRDQAEKVQLGSLEDYERYTPQGAAGTEAHARGVAENLARLRAFNESLDREEQIAGPGRAPAGARAPRGVGAVEVDQSGSTAYLLRMRDGHSDEPVVVEQVRARVPDSTATRTDIVVRQGDHTLLVVKPKKNQVGLDSEDLPDESEFVTGDWQE